MEKNFIENANLLRTLKRFINDIEFKKSLQRILGIFRLIV